MADISMTKSHSVDRDELRRRLQAMADDMRRKFGVQSRWDGDTCVLSGGGVKDGKVTLSDTSVSLELNLGMMARLLKGQIEKEIEAKVKDLLRA